VSSSKRIRVLIADDFKTLRDVIRLYLERADDMDVIDEAPDLFDALASAKALHPDVIIMNDYLPPIDSANATLLLRKEGITSAILVISMGTEAEVVERSFDSGVNGFIYKEEIDKLLVDAIRRVQRGERFLSPKAGDAYWSRGEK
jgi:DNA-binding NarL/FixJ family response regulator